MTESTDPTSNEEQQEAIDPALEELALQQLYANQSITKAAIAGIAAALLGASAWAVITTIVGVQIGWMAVGVGFLVGAAIRFIGKGYFIVFGLVGAVCSLLGCLLGNLLSACYFLSVAENVGFFFVLTRLTPSLMAQLLSATFSVIDIVFYGIAVYEGYRFSIRKATNEEIIEIIRGSAATGGPA